MSVAIRQHAARNLLRARPMAISRIHTTAAVSQVGVSHTPDRVHGSYHWNVERAATVAMVPLVAAQLTVGASPVTDALLGVVLPIHLHIGLDACIVDYLPARKSVAINKLATWTLNIATAGVLVGCYQFNMHDIGITELISRAWTA